MPRKKIALSVEQGKRLKLAMSIAEERVLITLNCSLKYNFSKVFKERVREYLDTGGGHLININEEIKIMDAENILGWCKKEDVLNAKKQSFPYKNRIAVNIRLIEENVDSEQLVNTLAHEYFHSVADNLAKKDQGHKGYWLLLARVYNDQVFGALPITREGDVPNIRETEPKYIVECPKCHQQLKYLRKVAIVKHPEKYHCLKCNEKMIRIK